MVDQVEVQSHSGGSPLKALVRASLERALRGQPLLLAAFGAVVILWAGVAATILHQHASAIEEGRRAGLAAAVAAVEGTATLFSAAEAVLVGASLRAGDRQDPNWRVLLDEAEKALPTDVAFLAAYKTNGRLIHRTGAPAGHRASIATLDHFRTPIATGRAGLYLGQPYSDPVVGRTVIPLVRLHPGPGRALRAILVAGIPVETLVRRLSAPDGAMALARADGTLLAVSAHWSTETPRAGGTLSAWQEGAVVEAGNGMPLMAMSTAVDGRAQGFAGRNAVQLAAAATLASIGLVFFGLFWRRSEPAVASTAAADRGRDDVAHAKSVFLATMSHEFRTPLNAVIGFAEVIRDQSTVLPPEKVGEYAQDIAASGQRLLQLVNDVLDLSHIESGRYEIRPQRLDLVEIVEAVNRIVAPLAEERRVTLAAPAIAQDLALTADRKALMQVLYNLVHNGVEFAEADGTVSVTALAEPDGTVRMDVIDDGAGIPEDDLARVMRPFEQSGEILTSSNTGTGLGLALVGKLVGLHGGRVDIASTVTEGTIVSVRLPGTAEAGGPRRLW